MDPPGVAGAALIVLPFAFASTAAAASTDEAALAARFAPVVCGLVNQPQTCGPGDPDMPIDVNLLFNEPTVALRGPWGPNDLVKVGAQRRRPGRRPVRLPPGLPGERARPEQYVT